MPPSSRSTSRSRPHDSISRKTEHTLRSGHLPTRTRPCAKAATAKQVRLERHSSLCGTHLCPNCRTGVPPLNLAPQLCPTRRRYSTRTGGTWWSRPRLRPRLRRWGTRRAFRSRLRGFASAESQQTQRHNSYEHQGTVSHLTNRFINADFRSFRADAQARFVFSSPSTRASSSFTRVKARTWAAVPFGIFGSFRALFVLFGITLGLASHP